MATPQLYFHPFASFCQKVLIALYEKEIAFERVPIDLGDAEQRARLEAVWPMARFPVLVDGDLTIPESSVIIEYLDRLAPDAPRMIPADSDAALQARVWDRFFDGFVAVNVTRIVVDRFRPEGQADPLGVAEAQATIRRAYDLFEAELDDGREWAVGDAFGLADCAAAPTLFYAGTIVPTDGHPKLAAYYQRLLARPSFARVVDEARPHRHLYPLPWPANYT